MGSCYFVYLMLNLQFIAIETNESQMEEKIPIFIPTPYTNFLHIGSYNFTYTKQSFQCMMLFEKYFLIFEYNGIIQRNSQRRYSRLQSLTYTMLKYILSIDRAESHSYKMIQNNNNTKYKIVWYQNSFSFFAALSLSLKFAYHFSNDITNCYVFICTIYTMCIHSIRKEKEKIFSLKKKINITKNDSRSVNRIKLGELENLA